MAIKLPGMGLIEKLGGSGATTGYYPSAKLSLILLAALMFLFLVFFPGQFFQNVRFLLFIAPIWLPPILVYFAFDRWLEYRQSKTIKDQGPILLELKLPRDTMKTPLAMETIFMSLHFGPGESNWYKRNWKGGVRPYFSVELVSLGGSVRFFIWTRESLRRGLESFFYAQYPGIEIIEAEDYSRLFDPSDKANNDMFGAEFELKKPDPYPIKTYVEFGLDREGMKPEEQIDPLTQVIEMLGSLGPKEQMWVQIIFRQSKKEKLGDKDWKEEAKDLIKEIYADAGKRNMRIHPDTGEEETGLTSLTPGERDMVAAIEKNISKPGFDVGLRAIYSAPKESYQGVMATFLLALFNPFNNQAYNVIGPQSKFSAGFGDYPWEDRKGKYRQFLNKSLVEWYRRRVYFHSPYVGEWMVLSSEELATLFHIPSSTIATPSLPRIQSTTSGAPSNLPT
jgi:hypothetical protein